MPRKKAFTDKQLKMKYRDNSRNKKDPGSKGRRVNGKVFNIKNRIGWLNENTSEKSQIIIITC